MQDTGPTAQTDEASAATAEPNFPSSLSVGELIHRHALSPVFQPIASLANGEILGYEALIRGPTGSRLRTPDELFAAAIREGLHFELELEAARSILTAAAALAIDRKLFVNISANALLRFIT